MVNKPEAAHGASGENQPPSGEQGGEDRAPGEPSCLRAACEQAPVEELPPVSQDTNSLPVRSLDADATLKGHEAYDPCERVPGYGAAQAAQPVELRPALH